MSSKKRLIIIDGNSLINRAYYAMQQPMITKEGLFTQGIYGFINMLNKILVDFNPEYLCITFDKKAPTFRHIEYTEYKANRKKTPEELSMQFPILKEVLEARNICMFEKEGYEADDIIGTIARLGEENGLAPMIVTGDKDALQLATDITKVFITKRGITDFDLYDKNKMLEVYNLTPTQFIDLKGLMGDSSDNIPGVPGIGEKTGQKLLLQFGSIENMYSRITEVENEKLKQKLIDNIELANMSKKLATIDTNVPLDISWEKLKLQEINYESLIKLYTKLEFKKFMVSLQNDMKTQGIELNSNNNVDSTEKEPKETVQEIKQVKIKNISDLRDISFASSSNIINRQTDLSEHTADLLNNSNNILAIKVFSDENHKDIPNIYSVAFLINGTHYYFENYDNSILNLFIEKMNKSTIHVIGHNIKEDMYALAMHGLTHFDCIFDTSIAKYLLEPTRSTYPLDAIVSEYLQINMSKSPDYSKIFEQVDLFSSTELEYEKYSLEYLSCILQLVKPMIIELKKQDLIDLYNNVELPLLEVLAFVQKEGFKVEKNTLTEIGTQLKIKINSLENEIYRLAGKEFNINSPIQLATVLFEYLRIPYPAKKKNGKYSTNADILKKLEADYPIISYILSYRTLSKLNSTYIEGLFPLITNEDKIHAHFMQTVTATGRISCIEPNLQNIPIKQEEGREIRKAFVPLEDGDILIGADYSQIELRVLAHVSQDENLLEAFNEDQDIHKLTAARVLGIPLSDVSTNDRRMAKAINFGIIYGMSSFGLSEELSISPKEGEKYISDYFSKHASVKKYMDEQIEFCKENGYVKTIMGRKRYIPDINSPTFLVKQLAIRLAMNTPIQGSAADIIKVAMINVYNELQRKNYKSKLILQVHDELIINVKKDELKAVQELLVRNMQNAVDLDVTLATDMNTGSNWYELK